MSEKICGRCGNVKSLEEFPKQSNSLDGRNCWCRACHKEVRKVRYQNHREEELRSNKEYKDANKARLTVLSREWRRRNPEKARKTRREEYHRNKDRRNIPYVREALRQASKRHYLANREKLLSDRRSRMIKTNGPEAEKFSYSDVFERDNGICYLCLLPVPSIKDCHFDHVIPLSRGGSHTFNNVKVTHKFCNLSKGNKPLKEGAFAKVDKTCPPDT